MAKIKVGLGIKSKEKDSEEVKKLKTKISGLEKKVAVLEEKNEALTESEAICKEALEKALKANEDLEAKVAEKSN